MNDPTTTSMKRKLDEKRILGQKIRRTTSRSNRRKIIVRKKYRSEKGMRERLWASNPHSNAESSSRIKLEDSEMALLANLSSSTKKKDKLIHEKMKDKAVLQVGA